jgi:hypothetical protein
MRLSMQRCQLGSIGGGSVRMARGQALTQNREVDIVAFRD